MSPQFVDFDGDGSLDIVAGTFDGSPHVARGNGKGWRQPEQILDRNGERILLNQFWNFDTKKWETTNRCDAADHEGEGHVTSAIAMDWDGDGDQDLLLGDHRSGHVYRRLNEGTAQKPAFTTTNELVLADGKPIDVPGTVATLRLVDWNRDGLLDLACGGMGDAYSDGTGAGVYVFQNTGSAAKPSFARPVELVPPSEKTGVDGPTRPDSGIYMDFGDLDGDGDLDLLVGGYSHWKPEAPVLTEAQQKRVAELQAKAALLDRRTEALMQVIEAATKDLDEEAAAKKRTEVRATQKAEWDSVRKESAEIEAELDPLVPQPKRVSYVWIYENATAAPARQTAPTSDGR